MRVQERFFTKHSDVNLTPKKSILPKKLLGYRHPKTVITMFKICKQFAHNVSGYKSDLRIWIKLTYFDDVSARKN